MKSPGDQCERVAELKCNLKSKIRQIRKISPKGRVIVCRLLPTKGVILNKKVVTFNRLIYGDLLKTYSGVQCVHVFEKFADHIELLSGDLSLLESIEELTRDSTLGEQMGSRTAIS